MCLLLYSRPLGRVPQAVEARYMKFGSGEAETLRSQDAVSCQARKALDPEASHLFADMIAESWRFCASVLVEGFFLVVLW